VKIHTGPQTTALASHFFGGNHAMELDGEIAEPWRGKPKLTRNVKKSTKKRR